MSLEREGKMELIEVLQNCKELFNRRSTILIEKIPGIADFASLGVKHKGFEQHSYANVSQLIGLDRYLLITILVKR